MYYSRRVYIRGGNLPTFSRYYSCIYLYKEYKIVYKLSEIPNS